MPKCKSLLEHWKLNNSTRGYLLDETAPDKAPDLPSCPCNSLELSLHFGHSADLLRMNEHRLMENYTYVSLFINCFGSKCPYYQDFSFRFINHKCPWAHNTLSKRESCKIRKLALRSHRPKNRLLILKWEVCTATASAIN